MFTDYNAGFAMDILKYPRAILLFLLTEEIPEPWELLAHYVKLMWERLPRGGKMFGYNSWLEWQVAFHQKLIESLPIITASLCSVLFFFCIFSLQVGILVWGDTLICWDQKTSLLPWFYPVFSHLSIDLLYGFFSFAISIELLGY